MCNTLIYPVNEERCPNKKLLLELLEIIHYLFYFRFDYTYLSLNKPLSQRMLFETSYKNYYFRLVHNLWQRKGKEKRRCDCQNIKYLTENTRYHINSASESRIWTFSERQVPVYKDLDIENLRQKNKRDLNQKRNLSNIIYDYITAKEVAQFRPCSLTSLKNGE